MGKRLKQKLHERKYANGNNHTEKCSVSLVIKEIKI